MISILFAILKRFSCCKIGLQGLPDYWEMDVGIWEASDHTPTLQHRPTVFSYSPRQGMYYVTSNPMIRLHYALNTNNVVLPASVSFLHYILSGPNNYHLPPHHDHYSHPHPHTPNPLSHLSMCCGCAFALTIIMISYLFSRSSSLEFCPRGFSLLHI